MAEQGDDAGTARLLPMASGACHSGLACACGRGPRTWLRQQLRCRQAAVELASRGATVAEPGPWPRKGADGVWEATPGWLPWSGASGSEGLIRQTVAAVSPSSVRSVTAAKPRTWDVLFGGGRPWRVTLFEWDGDEFPYDPAVALLADRLVHGCGDVTREDLVSKVREAFPDA